MSSSDDWKREVKELIDKALKCGRQQAGMKGIKVYEKALALIPEPVDDHFEAAQIRGAIGELHFLAGRAEQALEYFTESLRGRWGAESLHPRLRLGEIRFARGEMELAKEEFLHAYRISGRLAFRREDPRYYELIRERVEEIWEEEVKRQVVEAERYEREGNLEKAVRLYISAFFQIPEPVTEADRMAEVCAKIGELSFQQRDARHALEYFTWAVQSKGGLGEPHIHLRLGQLRYERGEVQRARDELMRAYMGAGPEIFAAEDPRYYEAIRDVVEQER